jgi:hypothetical protein
MNNDYRVFYWEISVRHMGFSSIKDPAAARQ